ncbi:MAG: dinitrogenase iron-molybdenum cofactor biosynthesis protein [Caldisericales bacterium]|jgi:predicted Fe-Mo cluster-binding NifX family protein|nr:dinitrogenase iron-molybdenum cofactor biosynthesis protein [Caldisericales bacterium]
MKLLISAQNPSLESHIDSRFGRSPWLILFNTETNQWETFQNPGASQSGGAGVAAAQFVVDQKAEVVISGDFGPHAARAFQAARIEMRLFTETTTTVQEAVDHFKNNQLPKFQ